MIFLFIMIMVYVSQKLKEETHKALIKILCILL